MQRATTEAGSSRDTTNRDWSGRIVGGPVTELPDLVPAPTFYAPTRKQRTRQV